MTLKYTQTLALLTAKALVRKPRPSADTMLVECLAILYQTLRVVRKPRAKTMGSITYKRCAFLKKSHANATPKTSASIRTVRETGRQRDLITSRIASPGPFFSLRCAGRSFCTVLTICFTICLCISPDLDGNRGIKMFCSICFTICLFISPDLDGSRALKTSLRY
jgi:hypothetical protein